MGVRIGPTLKPRALDIRPSTILVFCGEGLVGDALMRLPFAAALRDSHPDAHITWLFRDRASGGGRRVEPLLRQFCDEVLFDVRIGDHPRELLRPPFTDRRWDLVIDTQRTFLRTLVARRLARHRFASFSARYWMSDVRPSYSWGCSVKVRHYGRQLMALLAALEGLDHPPAFRPAPLAIPPAVTAWAEQTGLRGGVLIAPGAGKRVKCWPHERIAAVARQLVRDGHRVGFVLGPAERGWEGEFAAAVPGSCFPLSELPRAIAATEPFATIALSRIAVATVAMDSGVGHMLAAGSPHHVALFGPTSPDVFEPAAAACTVVTAGAFGGSDMVAIPSESVLAAVQAALRAANAASPASCQDLGFTTAAGASTIAA